MNKLKKEIQVKYTMVDLEPGMLGEVKSYET